MKITIKRFRQLIREVGLSPSLKQNKPLEGPFDNKNVGVSLEKLQAAFEQALSLDLIVRSMDEHYNEETREFDDGVYEEIKNIVNSSREKATQAIKQGLIGAWDAAHNDRQAQPASGVHPVAKKAA